MKILHIHDVAGVACVIAKFMDKTFNTENLVVARKIADRVGLMTSGETWNCGAKTFTVKCLWLARKFDVVHVHDFDKIVPWLKRLYHNKPIILHYHGTRIRNRWKEREQFWSKADVILVSTPDLLKDAPKHAIYIPNPIDTEIFRGLPEVCKQPNSTFTFNHYLNLKKAKKYATQHKLILTLLKRNIPHGKMPYLFNQYKYYIDRTEIPSLSKTALEALACGLEVIRWDGKIIEKFPEQHKPQNVVAQLYELYRAIL